MAQSQCPVMSNYDVVSREIDFRTGSGSFALFVFGVKRDEKPGGSHKNG